MNKIDIAMDVIARVAHKDKSTIQPEDELTADLGIDSPKALQLLTDLEDTLKIEIGEDDAVRMQTVKDVLAYVEKHG